MAINDEIRAQRQKLKGQGFKAHLSYFWSYYKLHTLAAVVIIIIVATTVRDIRNKKPYALYAVFLNSTGAQTQELVRGGFAEYADIDLSQYDCLIDTSTGYNRGTTDEITMASSEKIFTLIAANDLDLIVADEPTSAHFAAMGDFMDLRDIYSEEELKSLGDDILYVDQAYIDYLSSDEYTDYLSSGYFEEDSSPDPIVEKYAETGEYKHFAPEEMEDPIPVGIIVKDSAILKESEAFATDTAVVSIVTNTQRLDTAKAFLEYIVRK